LQKKLKVSDELKLKNINTITRGIIERKRFTYSSSDIFHYLKLFLCCRDLSKHRRNPRIQKHFFFEKAENKLQKELDVINLLKSMRNMKLVAQVLLSQRQRMLLRF